MNQLNKYFPRKLQSKHEIIYFYFGLLDSINDFWLIDSNFVGVMRFYKDRDYSDKSIDYMFIEEGIIMGIHGENPPLMKTRKKIFIGEARLLWQKLLNEGWQKTNKKW